MATGTRAAAAPGSARVAGVRDTLRHQPTEIRMGLVLYGGVSLAVYMAGVATEFLNLVRAGRSEHPRDLLDNDYWELLSELQASATVDVVAGASAGGINGIMLSQALAGGANLDALAALWRNRGDLYYLLNHGDRDGQAQSLLNGDWFLHELELAMQNLSAAAAGPLVEDLDLFVSATDLHGRYWRRQDFLGHDITGRQHLKVFHLRHRMRHGPTGQGRAPVSRGHLGYVQNDFGQPDRLARIARATASFPVAFPPVELDIDEVYVPDPRFPVDPRRHVWMADGGYLMNKPFAPVLRAIFHRAAHRPVDRLLFYVEPLPEGGIPAASRLEAMPNALATVFKAVELPMYQGIDTHLKEIEEHNNRVRHLRSFQDSLSAFDTPEATDLRATHVYAGYRTMRLQHLREQLNEGLSGAILFHLQQEAGGAPAPERVESVTRPALEALGEYLNDSSPEALLHRLDVDYHVRRVHYLIEEYGRIYYGAGPGCPPELVEELPPLEWALWRVREYVRQVQWEWWRPQATAAGALHLQPVAQRLMQALVTALEQPEPDPDQVRQALHQLLSGLGDALVRAVDDQPAPAPTDGPQADLPHLGRTIQVIDAALEKWQPMLPAGGGTRLAELCRDFLSRDLLLFPLTAYGTLGERDQVEWARISPYDADSLVKSGPPYEPLQDHERRRLGWLGRHKVAGDELGSFSGFLSARWRTNDQMWGRLDAADQIISTLVRRVEQQEDGPADIRYFGVDPDRVRLISHRVRQRIYKAVLRSVPATDLFPELAGRIRDAVAERRAANRGDVPLRDWLYLNSDILPYETVQALMALGQRVYELDVAGAGAEIGHDLPGMVETFIQGCGFGSLAGEQPRPVRRGRRIDLQVPGPWIDLLTWRQLQLYLLEDHTTGRESVRDLDARVLVNTVAELAENARQTVMNLLPAPVRGKLPVPLRWAGQVITTLRGVVRAFVPRAAPEQEGTAAPFHYGRVAGAAAAVSAAVTYLASHAGQIEQALATVGWVAVGVLLFAWLIWPGRWLLRIVASAPPQADGAFWLGLSLLTMVGIAYWIGSSSPGLPLPFTDAALTPALTRTILLAAGGGMVALWFLAGLAGALGRGRARAAVRRQAGALRPAAPAPAPAPTAAARPPAPGADHGPGEPPEDATRAG